MELICGSVCSESRSRRQPFSKSPTSNGTKLKTPTLPNTAEEWGIQESWNREANQGQNQHQTQR